MKCYYDHTQGHVLDYYAGDIPFQYKVDGRHTEFIGNLASTVLQ